MATKVGVVLSGCGFKDGSEIHESVLSLLALDEAGAEVRCFAPDVEQARVVDHRTGKETGEKRNVLAESARIARGKIQDLKEARAKDLDAVVFPGGFGAALNLSSFATKGKDADVHPEAARILREMHAAKKPIGAICIAPAVVSRVLGQAHPRLTIGDDKGTAAALEASGAVHENCPVEGFVVDRENRIVTTPAYMYNASIAHVAKGVRACVREVLAMAGARAPAGATR
jgi:enhancing lycopene biosynthesis protein 2